MRYTHKAFPVKNESTTTYLNEGHVTFQVGDKVIYPNHGLGIVERIEEKTILGTTCGFFHLRIVANDTTVLVPVANVDGVGLRKAIEDAEVDRLFSLLGDGKIDNHQNWKGRFKDNSDKMRTGSIYDMADVLKSLTFLSKSKSLSFREKRMLDRAKALIISEVSEVMRQKALEVEEQVDRALEKCFTTKVRNINRDAGQGQGHQAGEGRHGAAARGWPPHGRPRVVVPRIGTAPAPSGWGAPRLLCSGPGQRCPGLSFVPEGRSDGLTTDERSEDRLSFAPSYAHAHSRRGDPLARHLRRHRRLHRPRRPAGAGAGPPVPVEAACSTRPATAAWGWLWGWLASATGSSGGRTFPTRAVVYCSNHESNVDPAVLFKELDPMLHVLYKAELHKVPLMGTAFDLGGFVAVDRADRRKSFASVDAGGGVARPGQFVPDLSRGHPQPHRRAAAVQEGRLHHGAAGAGADCAGRGQRRARLDAQGQRDRPAGDE